MKSRTKTQTYIVCPNCGEGEARVDQMFGGALPRSFGPWFCECCGRSYTGIVNAPDDIDVELSDEQRVKTLDLLVLEPQDKPVFFVVASGRYPNRDRQDRSEDDGKRYHYEEHSCPTNFVECEAIISDGDDDPHGVFRYVRSVDTPEGYDDTEGEWRKLFPEVFDEEESVRQPLLGA